MSRMIEVPAEAFALMMAYSHTPADEIPLWIENHPAYPGNKAGRSGHLTFALKPYAREAMEMLKSAEPVSTSLPSGEEG